MVGPEHTVPRAQEEPQPQPDPAIAPDPDIETALDDKARAPAAPNRPIVELLEQEDSIAKQMVEALEALRAHQMPDRVALAQGAPVSEFVSAERLAYRDRVRELLPKLASALQQSRAEAIRELIDAEGLSVQMVSRIVGHPRQLVKRLYDSDRKANPS
jgi:hypothetical protein